MNDEEKTEKCKRMLFKMAVKHGVAPRIISEQLLSKEDKEDMLNGHISIDTLDCMIKAWKESSQGSLKSDDRVNKGER